MDLISVDSLEENRYVLVAESKRSSTGEVKRQCMLAMKDMWDNNASGEVYGFVTSGASWQMIKYDRTSLFKQRSYWCYLMEWRKKGRSGLTSTRLWWNVFIMGF